MARFRSLVLGLSVACAAGPAASQDFHFISSRDTAPAGPLNFEIYRYVNGTQTRVTNTSIIEQHPIASPLNNLLYFIRPGPIGRAEVYQAPLAGGPAVQVTADGHTGVLDGNHHVFLHPNETSLFVTTGRNDDSEIIREMSLAGVPIQTVVDHGAGVELGHSPAETTPSGDKLYYASKVDGDFEIYRSNLDGSNQQQLTTNDLYDSGAAVKPDGQLVAFTREDPNPCVTQIWVMNHDGTSQTQVTTDSAGFKWALGWDGADILYASNESGDQRIYSIATNGSNKVQLVNGVGDDMHLLPDLTCGFNLPEIEVEGPAMSLVGSAVAFAVGGAGPQFAEYVWNFGDGSTGVSTGAAPNAMHTYATQGDFNVTVEARDNCTPPNKSIGMLPTITIIPSGGNGPSLSEWGALLVILSGMIAGTLAIRRREVGLEAGRAATLSSRQPLILDPTLLARLLAAAAGVHLLACAAAYAYFGELAGRDVLGGALTAVGTAYLLHLWLSSQRD